MSAKGDVGAKDHSSYNIDYAQQIGPCCFWGIILTICTNFE